MLGVLNMIPLSRLQDFWVGQLRSGSVKMFLLPLWEVQNLGISKYVSFKMFNFFHSQSLYTSCLTKRPDPSGRLEQVCSVFPESEPSKLKQILVCSFLLISGLKMFGSPKRIRWITAF